MSKMTKQQFSTDDAPQAPAFLSQVIVSNGMVFVAGQIHNTTDGQLIEGSVTEKLAQIMSNIKAILKAAECRMENIVKVTIYVTDMTQMSELNEAYPTYLTEPFPAREAVCVQALPLGATIEISVIAVK